MDKLRFVSSFRPKVATVKTEYGDVHLRTLTVGDNNYALFERRVYLIKQAQALGLEFDVSDEDQVDAAIRQVPDKYGLARSAALVLCDSEGNLLFDANNQEDLDQINQLSQEMLLAINGDLSKKKS